MNFPNDFGRSGRSKNVEPPLSPLGKEESPEYIARMDEMLERGDKRHKWVALVKRERPDLCAIQWMGASVMCLLCVWFKIPECAKALFENVGDLDSERAGDELWGHCPGLECEICLRLFKEAVFRLLKTLELNENALDDLGHTCGCVGAVVRLRCPHVEYRPSQEALSDDPIAAQTTVEDANEEKYQFNFPSMDRCVEYGRVNRHSDERMDVDTLIFEEPFNGSEDATAVQLFSERLNGGWALDSFFHAAAESTSAIGAPAIGGHKYGAEWTRAFAEPLPGDHRANGDDAHDQEYLPESGGSHIADMPTAECPSTPASQSTRRPYTV